MLMYFLWSGTPVSFLLYMTLSVFCVNRVLVEFWGNNAWITFWGDRTLVTFWGDRTLVIFWIDRTLVAFWLDRTLVVFLVDKTLVFSLMGHWFLIGCWLLWGKGGGRDWTIPAFRGLGQWLFSGIIGCLLISRGIRHWLLS